MKPNFKKAGYVSPRKKTPSKKSPLKCRVSPDTAAMASPSTQQRITDFFPSSRKSRCNARPKKLCLSFSKSKKKLFPEAIAPVDVVDTKENDDDWDDDALNQIEAEAFKKQLPLPVRINTRKKWALLTDMSEHVEGVVSGSRALLYCISSCSRFATVVFDGDTEKIAAKYQSNLELPEQMLYFYLFMRKWNWISLSRMKYEFLDNLQSSLKILEDAGFLEALTEDAPLEEILSVMKAPDLKTLCKRYKLDDKARQEQLIASLLKASSRKSFFTAQSNLKREMAKQAFKLIGDKCVRLTEAPRKLFMKMAVVACSPLVFEGKSYTFNERFNALKDKLDEVKQCPKKLPQFNLSSAQLFNTPYELEQYVEAVTLKLDVFHLQDIKKHEEASQKVLLALDELKAFLSNEACLTSLERRPRHLWKFTSGYNYASAVKEGVDILKRINNYEKALEALDLLLGQNYFIKHARGSWYSERALILDKYLGRGGSDEEFETLVRGLSETDLSAGRRSLLRRADIVLNRKIRGLTDERKCHIKTLMAEEPVLNWPVHAFHAQTAEEGGPMKRVVYVQNHDTAKAFMNVEQIAMSHYRDDRGFPSSIHDEGTLLKHLVITAFSSVIYDDSVENVFVTKLQDAPLDWGSSGFYTNRQQSIEALCTKFKNGGVNAILSEINSRTSSCIPLIKNDLVSPGTASDLHDFLHCLGVEQFLKVSNYLLENFRARRSGLPDLTLWDMRTKRVLLAEVKSPTDSLSVTQEIWLNKLNELGIPAEECRINEPKNRKKRKVLEESSGNNPRKSTIKKSRTRKSKNEFE